MARTSEGAVLTDRHRRAQVRLAITADSQARRLWDSSLDVNDLKRTQPIWKNAMLHLLETWWNISARTAADYLPRFREAETGDGSFETAVPRFDRSQAATRLDWTGATNVLWHIARGETQEAAYAAARSLFLGMFHEAVLTGGRATIERWARKDTRAIGWRRVSDGDPCAFCAMLVSRGPVYTSAAKAGLRASDGRKYHPHCGCTVEVVYGDWKPTEREKQWIDDYYRAAESLPKNTSRTYDVILPIMRRNGDFRDSKARRSTPEALGERRKAYAEKKADLDRQRSINLTAALGKRGSPMNIETADRGNTNPGYWSGIDEYGRNCQSCVPAYEMRRRGYDVVALPLSEDATQRAIRSDTTLAWRNPDTGRHPAFFHMRGRDADATERRIIERIKPGRRYAMQFGWAYNDKGHIVVVERLRTKGSPLIVVDPQKGRIWKLHDYLQEKNIDFPTLGIYRMDNLELEPEVATSLMKARTS